MGYSKESLAKKNVFPQKYDEIRRLDGTLYSQYEDVLTLYGEGS